MTVLEAGDGKAEMMYLKLQKDGPRARIVLDFTDEDRARKAFNAAKRFLVHPEPDSKLVADR